MNDSNLVYIEAELKRLDLLLHRQILRLRTSYQLSLDEFRGLYISNEQVDSLINQASNQDEAVPTVEELTGRAEALRETNREMTSDDLPWARVAKEFGLSQFEQDILLLALAPEINVKYETLYAYLNNDVTRKWPTHDLALNLFSNNSTEKANIRQYLLPEATLYRSGLLQSVQDTPGRTSWLAGGFFLPPVISQQILGIDSFDPILVPFIEQVKPLKGWQDLHLSSGMEESLQACIRLLGQSAPDKPTPVLIFEGRYGSGKREAAEAICQDMGIALLCLDLDSVRASSESLNMIIQRTRLQQRLQNFGIYVEELGALFDKEGNPLTEGFQVVRELIMFKAPVFLASPPELGWRELMKGQRCLSFQFGDPSYTDRLTLWKKTISQNSSSASDPDLKVLANRFVLNAGQISDAVLSATDSCNLSGDDASEKKLSHERLFDAARAQSDQSLGRLAVKVNTIHGWDDLVLPKATLRRVKEIASAIENRQLVYSEWGFDRRITLGKGLMILFSGASGTGKTMTAGVIARDMGLELYKIDLSAVVSKYIGETEKNLDRIFRAAQCSNAILLFDEADALFGKRSEVKDAHDRYANIEVAYLLQKMEEHEGVVILASNLSNNIDQAFARRMHYVLTFPLPDETHREQLWRGMFPPQVPLGDDVDLQFLARQFQLAGGDIRNVALDAAFLAAQDGRIVTMEKLTKAMSRQMIKQGKIPSHTDFKQYHSLIAL
jgi:replication-associated recombination protein RarA